MLSYTKPNSVNVLAKYNFQQSSELFLISCPSCVTTADGNCVNTFSRAQLGQWLWLCCCKSSGLDLGPSVGKDYKTEGSYHHFLFMVVLGNTGAVLQLGSFH